jgi:hypothetical protein
MFPIEDRDHICGWQVDDPFDQIRERLQCVCLILGVKFADGIEVVRAQAQAAAA